MLEDEQLKWKFRRGSKEALARIYEKYLDSMLTLAMGLLNDAGAAEDVVQDVFVSFAQSRHSFRMRGSLSGYLATSVVNRVRNRKRRLRRHACRDARSCVRGDYETAGRLLPVGADRLKQQFGSIKFLRIVSIGPATRSPGPAKEVTVPCTIAIEESGRKTRWRSPASRSILFGAQPSRWTIRDLGNPS